MMKKSNKVFSISTFVFMFVSFMAMPMSSVFAGNSITGIVSMDSCGIYQAAEEKKGDKEGDKKGGKEGEEEPDCE